MKLIIIFMLVFVLTMFSSCAYTFWHNIPKKEKFKYYDSDFKFPSSTDLKSNRIGFYYTDLGDNDYEYLSFYEDGYLFIGITGISPDSLSNFHKNYISKQEWEYGIYKATGDDRVNYTIKGYYYKDEFEGVAIIHKDSIVVTPIGSSKKRSFYFKEW